MNEPWTLEDELSDVCADLISERRYEPFVHRLLTSPMGTWIAVAECCDGLPELPPRVTNLLIDKKESLVVTHLSYPERDCIGLSLILFFHKDSIWSMTATYNRERLLRGS